MAHTDGFDPNAIGLLDNNIFGLPFTERQAELILIPVPWEVTVSYRSGTAQGPEDIFDASFQVDLFDPDAPGNWKKGYFMREPDEKIYELGSDLREKAADILDAMANGVNPETDDAIILAQAEINVGCAVMCDWVHDETIKLLKSGKKVGLLGGDHSTPFGFVQALGEVYDDFGILQIDAHADLRDTYEGFNFSHASIMFNVLNHVPQVSRLVQVGIRDYCDEELQLIESSGGRIKTFFDRDIKNRQYEGASWRDIVNEVVNSLPQNVYISFDIDGLDPKLCPNTGTPVPGGFETEQIYYLFRKLHESGRKLIGFDLNEVSSGNEEEGIDAITGARVLYKLCNYLVM